MTESDRAGRLRTRLQRVQTQIHAFRELHSRDLSEAAERLGTIAKIQADELQMILDELADIARSTGAPAGEPEPPSGAAAAVVDPAAGSPKRAQWLAEQERRAHMSRRELLRGRETD